MSTGAMALTLLSESVDIRVVAIEVEQEKACSA